MKVAALCLVVVLAAHYPSVFGFFQADDFVWLLHGDWQDAWRALEGSWGFGSAYRPLTRFSYVVDAHVFGAAAWGWHAENLCLHAVNAVLVGSVARRLGWRQEQAAAMACVFAAFPMDWESVDWISGRTGLLCVLFGLLAVRAWLDLVLRGGGWSGIARVSVWQVLGMLCYEPAAVLPAVLAVGGLMLIMHGRAAPAVVWRSLAVVCGSDAVFWIVRRCALGRFGINTDVAAPHPVGGVIRNLAGMGVHALHFMGAPVLLVVFGLVGWGLAARRGETVGWLAICGVLYAPFAFVDGFTERFSYAASVALAFALVLGARSLPVSGKWRGALVCGLILVFAAESNMQARGMRQAGDRVRALLAGVRAVSGVRGNLVFSGVPDNAGRFYLLRGVFGLAAARAAPGADMTERLEAVCANSALRARAMSGPTHLFEFDVISGRFTPAATQKAGCLNIPPS